MNLTNKGVVDTDVIRWVPDGRDRIIRRSSNNTNFQTQGTTASGTVQYANQGNNYAYTIEFAGSPASATQCNTTPGSTAPVPAGGYVALRQDGGGDFWVVNNGVSPKTRQWVNKDKCAGLDISGGIAHSDLNSRYPSQLPGLACDKAMALVQG